MIVVALLIACGGDHVSTPPVAPPIDAGQSREPVSRVIPQPRHIRVPPLPLTVAEARAGSADLTALAAQIDPASVASTLGSGEAVFRFVRDSVRTEPYRGLLRGAAGTLAQGAGDDLDKALLLVDLLGRVGTRAEICACPTAPRPSTWAAPRADDPLANLIGGALEPWTPRVAPFVADTAPEADAGPRWRVLVHGPVDVVVDPASTDAAWTGREPGDCVAGPVPAEEVHRVDLLWQLERQGVQGTERIDLLSWGAVAADAAGRPIALDRTVLRDPTTGALWVHPALRNGGEHVEGAAWIASVDAPNGAVAVGDAVAEWLTVTISSPGRAPEVVHRALWDRSMGRDAAGAALGVVAWAGTNGPDGVPAALGRHHLLTIGVGPHEETGRAVARAADTALLVGALPGKGEPFAATLQVHRADVPADVLTRTADPTDDVAAVLIDRTVAASSVGLGRAVIVDGPNAILVTTGLDRTRYLGPSVSTLAIDVLNRRMVAPGGAPRDQVRLGLAGMIVESALAGEAWDAGVAHELLDDTPVDVVSAADILDRADRQGLAVVPLDGAAIAALPPDALSYAARSEAIAAIGAGRIVLGPPSAPDLAARDGDYAWLVVDPVSGSLVDRLGEGSGGADVPAARASAAAAFDRVACEAIFSGDPISQLTCRLRAELIDGPRTW